ncbi:deoxynucleoside kinase [Gammaproteobacteria bacterium]|nr:deoxynucleoside kinase [Gammaproteobacteria bacterium]MEE3279259.1 deoxynucleoside kinase [Pseudomonadota bacterium]
MTTLVRPNINDLPRYVAVEGPIGAGKTTLATRLAETFKYPLLLEPASDNPFLDRFYREGRKHALPTQLFFLLHRADQIAKLAGPDLLGPTVISDFLIEKDRLFAELTLDKNELALYEQIYKNLMLDPPAPDLVIYLQAPISVLLERIRERGIASEQHIDSDYLITLSDAYTDFFHFYDQAPLLIVNAEEADFSHNDSHFDALLEQVIQMNSVRQYFNPHPTLI